MMAAIAVAIPFFLQNGRGKGGGWMGRGVIIKLKIWKA